MKISMDPMLSAIQTQKLDPKLIMANTILQMSRMELEEKIEEELLENPALEMEENKIELKCPICQLKLEENICPICGKKSTEKTVDDISEKLLEREEYLEEVEYLSRSFIEKYRSSDNEEMHEQIVSRETLRDYLYINLPLVLNTGEDFLIGKYLLNYIDDDGYLKYEENELLKKFNIDNGKLEKIIKAIQTMEPAGIGARNLKECITLQLKNVNSHVPSIVWKLLSDKYWNDFHHRRFTILSESIQVTIDDIRNAAYFIKNNVNPYPGRNFSINMLKQETVKLTPDVIIKENNEKFEVETVYNNYKNFRINRIYKELYEDIKRNKNKYSSNEIEHTRNYFHRARIFIENLYQREETIVKVTKKIVELQKKFFYHGISHLIPLTRVQVAEALNIHDSTVSRATKDKFVQLPSGKIVNFDFFFDPSLPIKEEIKAIIDKEDKDNPMSDKEISEMLSELTGINLARRTVAKYREEMHISSSRDRKYV
ncbi:MAG: RNA polymerase factor sigma-54 [Candidatus Eremiobacterota bacterium]